MEIVFYQNKSDDRVVNKSLDTVSTLNSCEVKRDCSIINPVFLVSGGVDDFADVNYCYVADFLRYYYITDIQTAGNGMTQITCRCDVLMSFSAAFLERDAIVARNQNEFNLMLDDSEFRLYSDPIIITKNFSGGFSSPCYVLTVAGVGTPVTP